MSLLKQRVIALEEPALTTVTHLVTVSSVTERGRTFHESKDVAVSDDTPTSMRPSTLYVVNFL